MAKKKKKKDYKQIVVGSIRNYLRKLWMQSPIRSQRLKLDAVYVRKTKINGDPYSKDTLIGYTCGFCGEFIDKKIENPVVHHIKEASTFDISWEYIERLLFPDVDSLVTGHKDCHKKHHKDNKKLDK